MQKLVSQNEEIVREDITVDEALKRFASQKYKTVHIHELAEKGANLSVYKQGDFEDLCLGPHVKSTKYIKAFKDKLVCQNDGRKGPGGGNDFYESAVAYPAEMLQNLKGCIQKSTNGADSGRKGFDWYHNIFIF